MPLDKVFHPDYSDNAIVSSSEEEDPPSETSPSRSTITLKENVFSSPRKNQSNTDQLDPKSRENVGDVPIKNSQDRESSQTLIIPQFNKRPLSDTPVGSTGPSPTMSTGTSKVSSIENSPDVIPSINDVLSVPPLKLSKRRGTTLDVPGVTKTIRSPTTELVDSETGSKLVIVMVGLPASGKSYISNKLTRYLNWLQHETKIFNVGSTRRRDSRSAHLGPSSGPLPDKPKSSSTSHNANFFNPENAEATSIREKWAMDTLDQLLDYLLRGPGFVGVFDATNSTKNRRMNIYDRIRARSKDIKVLFLESICHDKNIIRKNIQLKLTGPDYKTMDPQLALKDFTERLQNYEKAYEPIDDEEGLQYIKMIDVGKKVVAYNIQGFLASQTVFYLLNFNLNERQIWVTRHGESQDNVSGKIGGDSRLTERGEKFARALKRFMKHEKQKFWSEQYKKFQDLLSNKEIDVIPEETNFNVWTSMLKRSVDTSKYFYNDDDYLVKEIRMLNELCAGNCEGMTYEEIQSKFPEEFNARIQDKLRYRYPGIGGESYLDVINRLRPIINEVERTVDNVLLITHRVVARVLLGYFMNLDRDVICNLDVPLHCIYLLEPKPYGVEWSLFEFDEEKDWFFKIPKENLHHKKVKEVDVQFRERKFSVVPTAPPKFSAALCASKVALMNPSANEVALQRSGPLAVLSKQRNPMESVNQIEIEKLSERLNRLKSSKN
ncbi:hypothetical protein WICMUC_004841 [Wickerhamomyces mucosus]|uniref:6-phosphofructo-2-kinase domain-containing protein n=1 Tax=Wickerhamomyces mucosus TaxID=1378264 RepID=A0A9P8PF04_9ASCO|nr:hypothetical protein WICMUC_004841 [Wickerhamomyces mucosus]